ncbi:hypothetical protein AN2V17_32860 [Vallitalea sp. AN17-2]|uniref:Uncharacterized protein n=1 Tax=Vallitalea maricola TaxID=3074433 RepID=A0ACB5UNB6_9FIRM|nr:hypothetical protein AN2V17_32860 [Vallitalea sp. AN17-2]
MYRGVKSIHNSLEKTTKIKESEKMYKRKLAKRIAALAMSIMMMAFYVPISATEGETTTEQPKDIIIEEVSDNPVEEQVEESKDSSVEQQENPIEESGGKSADKESIDEADNKLDEAKDSLAEQEANPAEEPKESPTEGQVVKQDVEQQENPLQEAENEQKETLETPTDSFYKQDYDGVCEFSTLEGGGTTVTENGVLNFTNVGDTRIIDTKSSEIADGEIEIVFTVPDDTMGRFGVLVRSIDDNNWVLIGNDGTGWGVNKVGKWDFFTQGKTFIKDEIVKLRVKYDETNIVIWAAKKDGDNGFEDFGMPILNKSFDWLPKNSGYQGYRKWFSNVTTKVEYMYSGGIGAINGEPQGIKDDTIVVAQYQDVTLPSTVKVIYNGGALIEESVTWNTQSVDTSKPGTVQVKGTIKDMSFEPKLNVKVNSSIVSEVTPIKVNMIKDSVDKSHLPTKAFVKLKVDENTTIDTVANITSWSELTTENESFTATGVLDQKTEDNSFATVTASGKIIDKSSSVKYTQEYTAPEGITWNTIDGSGRYDIDKTQGELTIINDADSNYSLVENESPTIVNGEFSVIMKATEASQYGILFRAISNSQYAGIIYKGGTDWAITGSNNLEKSFTGPEIAENTNVTIKCRYIGNKVTVIINDNVCLNQIVTGITLEKGKVGYVNYGTAKTLKVTELINGEVGTIIKTAIPQITYIPTYKAQTYPRVMPSLPSIIDIKYYGGISGRSQIIWNHVPIKDIVANTTLQVGGIIEGELFENLAAIEVLNEEPRSYELDFENKETAANGWKIGRGSGSISATDDGKLLISGLSDQGVAYFKLDDTPALKNMIFEADVEFVLATENSVFRGGPLIRYIDSNNWANISLDVGKLVWKNGQGYGSFPGSFSPQKGKVYRMKLKAHEGNFSISFDGNEIGKQSVSSLPDGEGYIGFHSWAGQSFIIDNVKVTEIPPLAPPAIEEKTTIISSEKMDVTVDENFPRVLSYKWKEDGSILHGEDEQLFIMEVNGEQYIPTVTSTIAEDKSSIIYTMKDFGSTGIELQGKMSVIDNKLKFEIINVIEPNVKFQTLNIPKQSLASVKASENGRIASVITTGDWNNIIEKFSSVQEQTLGVQGKTYAFISNNDFAVSVDSNVTTGGSRISLSTDNRGADKKTGIGAGAWTYREELGKADTGADYFQEHKPWVQIAIAKDENNDSTIDWQDAAILYRKDMKIPFGGEDIKNNISYVSMNIGYTQNPFLKGLDMVKNIYNYTDGFGQIVLEKGYQAEGHDDSHPDYDHFGIRQGGIKDFNKLIEAGKDYNAKIGIHINATEYHPDAFTYPQNIVNLNSPGWGWLDKASYVDQRKDITTGELYRRLDLLKKAAPELNFVYVDVYTGNDWNAAQLGEKVNSLGYMLGTEMNGPLEQYVTWTHWGGDAAYPNKGNNSQIMRFIKYNTQDTFIGDPLLKGNKHLLPGGWGDQQTVLGEMGTGIFYNNNLLTKYMQHFEIIKMTSDQVDFTEGVKAVREGDDINYYKDGRLIAATPEDSYNDTYVGKTKLFLPWVPNADDGNKSTSIEKIYAWTPFENDTTQWTLPSEWSDSTRLKLYKLDDLGRHYVKDIDVTEGKIILSLEQNIPYLVTQGELSENRLDTWGEGQQIVDPGFDSAGFVNDNVTGAGWTKTGGNVSIVKEVENAHQGSPRGGNDILKITNGEGGISQVINGLVESKTYSISTWIQNNDERTVTLNVNCGGKDYSTVITRRGKERSGQAVKFRGDTFLRANIEFTVPKGISAATVTVNVAEGNGTVYVDDFRCYEEPGVTSEQGYAFYEDFENVDEGISPFVLASGRGGSNRSHLAEKDLYGRQFMSWVINGRFSLKSNQQDGETGEMLITENGAFTLKPNTTYELGLTYALARDDINYSLNIKQPDKTVVANIPLTVTGSSNEIEQIDRGVAKKVTKTFTTGNNTDGLYMTLDKQQGKEQIILDDIYIKEVTNNAEPNLAYVNLNTSVNEISLDMEFIPFNVTALMSNGVDVDMSKAELTYDISDTTVLQISDNKMKPLKKGTADITAKVTVDNKTVNSNTVTIKVG